MSLQLLPSPQGVFPLPLPANLEQHLTPRELGTIFSIAIGALLLLSAPLVAHSFVIGAVGLSLLFIASGSSFYARRPREEPIPVPQVFRPLSEPPLRQYLFENSKMSVHTSASVISFIGIREIALIIRHVNKQANGATELAIRIQLLSKISLTFKEISNYQHALGLRAQEDILRLVDENSTSRFSQLDLYYSANDALLFSLFTNAHYSKITSINLTGCRAITDQGLRVLPPSLVSLQLGDCLQITDQGLKELPKLTNLKSLDLSSCSNITDIGIALLTSCINITSLDLSRCRGLTDQGLKELSKLSNLESLDLKWCRGISDGGVLQFAHHRKLTSLILADDNQVTDQVVIALSRFSQLTSLSLIGSDRITDCGLEALAQLPSLVSLDLDLCGKITENGIRKFAISPSLVSLTTYRCFPVRRGKRIRPF